jgi:hypothetical protein
MLSEQHSVGPGKGSKLAVETARTLFHIEFMSDGLLALQRSGRSTTVHITKPENKVQKNDVSLTGKKAPIAFV